MFCLTSFGESHGECVGVIVDGCPAGLPLSADDIQPDLNRRKPGNPEVSSPRREDDQALILSGVFNGKTTGAPICLLIRNNNSLSADYESFSSTPRPGHADYTNYVKYCGFADYRGGGRASGRITAGIVMAGTIAKKLLRSLEIELLAHTTAIGSIRTVVRDYDEIRRNAGNNAISCANLQTAELMQQEIVKARDNGDSLGGIIEVIAINTPAGLGEPFFDTLEGELAKAFFAIPSVKGVEFGAGFTVAQLKGSENNDHFTLREGKILCTANHAGGILGGISNGMPIVARLAIKPTPSIAQTQRSVNWQTHQISEISVSGRHDPCIVPRAVVVAESTMAIVLCDLALRAGMLPRVLAL